MLIDKIELKYGFSQFQKIKKNFLFNVIGTCKKKIFELF